MRLEKRLEQWNEKNLITEEQKKSIMEFEILYLRNVVINAFYILGIAILGVGIFILVASNWNDFSDSTKITLDLISLIVVTAIYCCLNKKNNSLISEFFLCALIVLYTISIVLILQIFSVIITDIRYYYLIWSLLIFPLLLKTKVYPLQVIWLSVILFTIYAFNTETIKDLYNKIDNQFIFCLLVPIILFGISVIFRKLKKYLNYPLIDISEKYFSVLSYFSLFIGFFSLLLKSFLSLFMFGLIILNVIFYGIRHGKTDQIPNYIFHIVIIFCTLFCKFFDPLPSTGIMIIALGAIIIIVSVIVSKIVKLSYKKEQND